MARTPKNITVKFAEKTLEYEVLRSFEFNSDRKRMSILLKKKGRVMLYIKGADNVILSRLSKKKPQLFLKEIVTKLDEFSKRGLRTLCFAMRVLDLKEVEYILKKLDQLPDNLDKPKLTGFSQKKNSSFKFS